MSGLPDEYFEESECPEWFLTLLRGDGEEWDEEEHAISIQRQWDHVREMHPIIRKAHIDALSAQLTRHFQRVAIPEISESLQATQQSFIQLRKIVNSNPPSSQGANAKKKRTVDAKLDTAFEDIMTALDGLTRLQKKRVLRRVSEELSE